MRSGTSDRVSADELVQRAIHALREDDRETARPLLAKAVTLDPNHDQAWLWLSGVVANASERRYCLERVLALNPENAMAQRGLETLPPGKALRPALLDSQTDPPKKDLSPSPGSPASRRPPVAGAAESEPFAPVVLSAPGKKKKPRQQEQQPEQTRSPSSEKPAKPAARAKPAKQGKSKKSQPAKSAPSPITGIPVEVPGTRRKKLILLIAGSAGLLVVLIAVVAVLAGPPLLASLAGGNGNGTGNGGTPVAGGGNASETTNGTSIASGNVVTATSDPTPDTTPAGVSSGELATPTPSGENGGEPAAAATATVTPTITPTPTETAIPTETPTPTVTPTPIVRGYVINGGNMRSEQRIAPDTVIGQVCPGDQLIILLQQAGWTNFELSKPAAECHPDHVAPDTVGWASSSLIERSSFEGREIYPELPPELPPAIVTGFENGETLNVTIEGNAARVRLIGVDAPAPSECLGPEAVAMARELLQATGASFVLLESDDALEDTDDEGRLLRYAWLPNGQMLNAELLDRGYARLERLDDTTATYQQEFAEFVIAAQFKEVGLWETGACP
jgi:endonuclease YncB( thermonuclease family)